MVVFFILMALAVLLFIISIVFLVTGAVIYTEDKKQDDKGSQKKQ